MSRRRAISAIVVGYAGTGKSRDAGRRARGVGSAPAITVRGAALSGIAAENLESGSGIASRTIASLEHQWGQGRELLTAARRAGDRRGRDDRHAPDGAGAVRKPRSAAPRSCWSAIPSSCRRSRPGRRSARSPSGTARSRSPRSAASARTGSATRRASWRPGAPARRSTPMREHGMVHAAETREEARADLIERWDRDRQAGTRQEPDHPHPHQRRGARTQ